MALVRAAAKAVASVIRPGLVRWRKFWDVDHRAPNFMTDAEYEAYIERVKEMGKAREKEHAQSTMRAAIARRLADRDLIAQEGAARSRTQANAGADELPPGTKMIGSMDATSFHILHGTIALIPPLLVLIFGLYARNTLDREKVNEFRLSNKAIMEQRLSALENRLADGTAAPGSPPQTTPEVPVEQSFATKLWGSLFGWSSSKTAFDAMQQSADTAIKTRAHRRLSSQAAASATAVAKPVTNDADTSNSVCREDGKSLPLNLPVANVVAAANEVEASGTASSISVLDARLSRLERMLCHDDASAETGALLERSAAAVVDSLSTKTPSLKENAELPIQKDGKDCMASLPASS